METETDPNLYYEPSASKAAKAKKEKESKESAAKAEDKPAPKKPRGRRPARKSTPAASMNEEESPKQEKEKAPEPKAEKPASAEKPAPKEEATKKEDTSNEAPKEQKPKQKQQHNRNQQKKQQKNQQQKGRQQQQKQQKGQQQKKQQKSRKGKGSKDPSGVELGKLPNWETFKDKETFDAFIQEHTFEGEPLNFNHYYELPLLELYEQAKAIGAAKEDEAPNRNKLLKAVLQAAFGKQQPIQITGVFDKCERGGILTYEADNYRVRYHSAYIPEILVSRYGIKRGQIVEITAHPPRFDEAESCPFALTVNTIMSEAPESNADRVPFHELTPYYPTERFVLEHPDELAIDKKWDNLSMRIVDLLTPIGLGQRGLIVAPPRTGKTVLLQNIAYSIREHRPDVHLSILLIDERPEEVTDFKRNIDAEIVSSTFDEDAENHVHAAEMLIAKSRRMVEAGKHVVVVLDSITRLARAYNTMMPSSGKILSGGVEANALQGPKRLFGSARNIEGGGSLTILGTALIDTGSRMDEVIFEEFKGTGNMELHLDRSLTDKRIFPGFSLERSGTRKEEILYHPDELPKIYSLRRAMKGVPPVEAMEMLIQRVKKTPSNAAFLMGLNR
tara:strand:+ start:81098 stop:82945 length:1848 start_codon:yes stop_codon:yes gene_type:complete